MLINNDEVERRLNNPLNLLNRVKVGLSAPKKDAMSLFVPNGGNKETVTKVVESERIEVSFNPFPKNNAPTSFPVVPPKITSPLPEDFSADHVNDSDAKIKLAVAHDDALDLLTASIASLKRKVDDNEIKASSIPSIITSASRVITDIRKERLEREKDRGNENIHFHFYCPTQKTLEQYETIEVTG